MNSVGIGINHVLNLSYLHTNVVNNFKIIETERIITYFNEPFVICVYYLNTSLNEFLINNSFEITYSKIKCGDLCEDKLKQLFILPFLYIK